MTKSWTRENLAWAAGLMEGEGWFTRSWKRNKRGELKASNRSGYRPSFRCGVDMTDLDVLERLQFITGMGSIYEKPDRPTPKGKKAKPCWTFHITKQADVYAWICAIYSFMGVRRKAKMFELLKEFAAWRAKPAVLVRDPKTGRYLPGALGGVPPG